jgi:hypothetical protein
MSRRSLVYPLLLVVALFTACGNNDTKLKVTGLEPEKGDAAGGSTVHVMGNRFMADGARNTKIYFGQHLGTVVRTASDSEIIVEAPGGKPNETVDVVIVFEPGGEIKIPHAFTYVEKVEGGGAKVDDLNTSKTK